VRPAVASLGRSLIPTAPAPKIISKNNTSTLESIPKSSGILKGYKDLYLSEYRRKAGKKKETKKGRAEGRLPAEKQHTDSDDSHTAFNKSNGDESGVSLFKQEENIEKLISSLELVEGHLIQLRREVETGKVTLENGIDLKKKFLTMLEPEDSGQTIKDKLDDDLLQAFQARNEEIETSNTN